jgi:ADP-heptose:LPS heptosyltransferase
MKVLFVYWHGLGDNVLATPAIKKYKTTTGHHVGWMMQGRFKSAELFKHNPYVDQLHWCSDAWNMPGGIGMGSRHVMMQAEAVALKHNYDKVIPITHANKRLHKIHRTAQEMGVSLEKI